MIDKKEIVSSNVDSSDFDSLTSHYKKALDEIKNKNFSKANEELAFIYRINPNSPYYYIAKLLIEFGYSSIEELKQKADDRVVSSPYFIRAEEYSDEKTKRFLNSLKREVSVKQDVEKLKGAPLEQLLKLFKAQKDNKLDGTMIYGLILSLTQKKYRFFDEDYINSNGLDDNFLSILNSVENSYHICINELSKYRNIKEIDNLVSQSIDENEKIKRYLLAYFSLNLDKYVEKGQLEELKRFLQNNYFQNEADALLLKIGTVDYNPTSKLKGKHLGLIITTSVLGVCVVALAAGALVYYFLTNSTVINGVKYVKNDNDGYTISEVNKDYLSSHNGVITLENTISNRNVNALSNTAFKESDVKEVKNFPISITEIPDTSFYNCKYLERFELSTSSLLESIGDNAFENCVLLSTLLLPNNLKTIGSKAFSSCYKLDSITIPASIETIGSDAFKGTDELTHLTNNSSFKDASSIGLTVRTITINKEEGIETDGSIPSTFYSWDEVVLPVCKSPKYGDFKGYEIDGLTGLYIAESDNKIHITPSGLKSIVATPKYEYKKEYIDSNVTYKLSTDGKYFIISSISTSGENASKINLKSKIGEIPVSAIERGAFENNEVIESISNFPSSIKEIPEYAFSGCKNLKTFAYDESAKDSQLTKIGSNAFLGCESLTSFELPSGISSIGKDAFKGTDSLLRFVNNSSFKCDGAELGFTKRSITYYKNNQELEDTSSLVNYYYICDEYVTLTLPSEDFKRVADTSVKVNGVAQSMNSDKESITVSTQNKASMSVYYSEEGYYDANTNKVKDGKYGLGFSGGASWYEQSTARYNYFISIERQSNASCLDLSLFDVEITARGNNGANYAITLNEEEGEFSFTTGSVDTITIQGVVKTKITGEVIDSYSLSVPVVEK